MQRHIALFAALGLAIVATLPAAAQEAAAGVALPGRSFRLVVPFPTRGRIDLI